MEVRTIEARVHGRYVIREGPREQLLVGFHGYAETAEKHLEQMLRIDGVDEWTVVSVQALHPFYVTRTGEVVASWMTSLDREVAIADNINYVRSVVAAFPEPKHLVFCGFSQGAAMAYRAAAAHPSAAGVIALGGDVPPDVSCRTGNPACPDRRDRLSYKVLIGRGIRDDWYSAEKFDKDLKFLQGRAAVTTCIFDGGHEWTDAFRTAAGDFLRRLTGQVVDESPR